MTGHPVLTATAICGVCPWTEHGDHADVDKAADKHTTRQKHPTYVRAEPVAEVAS